MSLMPPHQLDPPAGGPGTDQPASPKKWARWIALNLMRGCDEETILQAGVPDGLDPQMAKGVIGELRDSPLLEAGKMLHRQVLKRDWILRVHAELARSHSQAGRIERVARPSRQEFIDHFYAPQRPVILTGVIDDWPALRRWTPDYLKAHHGDVMVEVQLGRSTDPIYELRPEPYRHMMRFGEFIDRVEEAGESNDLYMTVRNWQKNWRRLRQLHGDIGDLVPYAQIAADSDRGIPWYGPRGTVTQLHHDHSNILLAQIRGRKRVRLISASETPNVYNHLHCWSLVDLDHVDEESFPLFKGVSVLDCTIAPGEVIFLPAGCWHHVTALDISISVSFWESWFGFPVPVSYDTVGEM